MSRDIEEHAHGPDDAIAVRDNARAERYEAVRDGEIVGIVIYTRTRRRIELIHTVTDPEHRGEGVASVLVRTVLAEARAARLPVLVICPFVESWLQRHPEQARGGSCGNRAARTGPRPRSRRRRAGRGGVASAAWTPSTSSVTAPPAPARPPPRSRGS